MLALLIFVVTLTLVIWQPRKLGIGWSALGGAAVALALGVVGWQDVTQVWGIVWDATFTFVALIIISLILDAAGVFGWAALHIARWGRGDARRLFPLIVLLGALMAAVFANDGAALLLTPIVISIVQQLRFSERAAFAFIITTGFIADTASIPLVISNLVNIVSANYFGVSFARYAAVMLPVTVISVAATLLVLWAAFGRDVPGRYDVDALPQPRSVIRDPRVFRAGLPLMGLLFVAYFVLSAWGVPFSLVTGSAALLLVVVAARSPRTPADERVPLGRIMREAPWQIVLFSLGMYLVVWGLGQAGATDLGATWVGWLGAQSQGVAAVGAGVSAAVVAATMNNLPSTLMGALAIQSAHISDLTRDLMVFANVIGNDLGPKFTPIGSLATLLWLHVLAQKGYRITWGRYMKVGLLLTPPVLVATLIALALWLPMIS